MAAKSQTAAKRKMLGKKRTPVPPIFEYGPLPAFHLFNQLPTELRLEIWDHVEIEPRVVVIDPIFKRKRLRKMVWLRCYTKTPAILHTCRESRTHVIKTKRYQQIFASSWWSTWINFDIDIIRAGPLPHISVDVDKHLVSRLHRENRPDLDVFLLRCLDLWVNFKMRDIWMYSEFGLLRWVGINGSDDPAQIKLSFRQIEQAPELPVTPEQRSFLTCSLTRSLGCLLRKRDRWYENDAEIRFPRDHGIESITKRRG